MTSILRIERSAYIAGSNSYKERFRIKLDCLATKIHILFRISYFPENLMTSGEFFLRFRVQIALRRGRRAAAPCSSFTKKTYFRPEKIFLKKTTAMIRQAEFTLRPRSRGFHLVTGEIEANLPPLPAAGLLHLFIKHTSAGLTLNENADPDVRTDLEAIFDRLVREHEAYYIHTYEGDDDMPAHAKSTLVGTTLTLPVSGGRLNLGTWQGIYLCEFRNRAAGRRIVATVLG